MMEKTMKNLALKNLMKKNKKWNVAEKLQNLSKKYAIK